MARTIEMTVRFQLAEDDGSAVQTIAEVIADSLANDVIQDEMFAGSGCEVMLGFVTLVSATEAA